MTHPVPDASGRVTYQIPREPTVTTEFDGVQVTFWIGSGVSGSLRLELEPGDALKFAADLTRSAAIAATAAAQKLAIGDCETCANLRLVNVSRNNRDWTERCPECGPRYSEVGGGFPPFPRIGGGVR